MGWTFWYCVLSHCIFTLILYKLTEDIDQPLFLWPSSEHKRHQQTTLNTSKPTDRYLENILKVQGSSVWCYGQQKKDRVCKFRNLCYSTKLQEYIFFHGHLSIIDGLPAKRCSPALLDLSSVDDHNLQYFHYVDAPMLALGHFTNITTFHEPSLIFHRFNPENLMHVIHDDLLPMFATLRQHFPDFENATKPFNSQVQLVFMEGREEGPFYHLYELFSEITPILLESFDKDSLVCFQETVVGISKRTTWYDYGFKVPQCPKINHTADASIIHQFTQYIVEKLGITKAADSDYVILFSREDNRLILNEFDIAFAISTNFHLKVVRLSLETNTLPEIIKSVQNCAGIVAMHGSILSLAIFLSPGTFLVELFPYAVDAENYTPYKTLTQIPGLGISYGYWVNKMKENNVMHPNRSKAEGGITHLSLEEQDEILNAETVPKHLCCEDPHWLFRIYQDTVVDIKSFVEVMQTVLDKRENIPLQTRKQVYLGKIREVHCHGNLQTSHEPGIFVSWQPPWNTQFFNPQDVGYEVWIQSQTTQKYMAYFLDTVTEYRFTENIENGTNYSVWVRGVLLGNMGPFSDICTCMTDIEM